MFELTELGKQHLRDHGIDTRKTNKTGSIEHQYWCKEAQRLYEKVGYSTQSEFSLGEGKAVDVVAEKDGQKIAVEIETGKSDFLGNIRKCAEGDFERLVIVATSSKVKKRIQRKITEKGIDTLPIIVVTGSEFVRQMELKSAWLEKIR